MVSRRSAAVGAGVFMLGLCVLATAQSMRAVERNVPRKVAQEGVCAFPIASPDGLWSACVDPFGQVVDLFTPDQPTTDNIFETLLYEASVPGSGLTRRVQSTYVVSAGPIVNGAGDSTWTRLTKAAGPSIISIEITNRMINGPAGGVQVQIRCENKGTEPITCKLFYYCDFDISGTFPNDEATPLFDGTGGLVGIEQFDVDPPNKPLLFGGCPNYKSWQIDLFPSLRNALDAGTTQLASADLTAPGAGDHTVALAGEEVVLEPGQSATMEVGIGGPGFSECKSKCPYDCDGSNDGLVGITDFLALLSQWGAPGGTCDKSIGDEGVGIIDFLALLSAWGPCPANCDPGDCDDGDACTEDTCDPDGNCVNTPLDCKDDGNPCTVTFCDPATGCVTEFALAGTECDDGDPCTSFDTCDGAGNCAGVLSFCGDKIVDLCEECDGPGGCPPGQSCGPNCTCE